MIRRVAATAMAMAIGFAGAASAQPCPAPSAANQACSQNCAQLTVGDAGAAAGATVDIPISFAQGADDGQSGQGSDDVSAIAFTLGVPGTGEAAPLQFDCTDGALAAGSVTVAPAIANDFTVVIENAQCTNRSRCLCPGDGQTRDNFVNVVVYGPKTLPDEGPVQIPVLPDTGQIATLRMRIATGTPNETTIPLHVFAATDGGSPAKPQFAANLSLGDQSACDVTGNTEGVSRIGFNDGEVTVGGTPTPTCVGDCNGNGEVVINELISGVNIALGNALVSTCTAFDPNGNGQVAINELVQGVNNALNGCPTTP